jgi:hypothetical protein
MRFKLLVGLVDARHSEAVLAAGREAGATGATVINFARGEDEPALTTGFLGWDLGSTRHVVLFLTRDDLAPAILESVSLAGELDTSGGTGLVLQLQVEDAVGLRRQWQQLADKSPPA